MKNIKKTKIIKIIWMFFCVFFIKLTNASDDFSIRNELKKDNINFIKANFTQTKKVSFISSPLVSKGNFAFLKSEGLYWEIKIPFPSTMIVNSKGVYQVANGEAKPTTNHQLQSLSEIFNQLLSGNFDELDSMFIFREVKSQKSDWGFNLIPKDLLLKKILLKIQVFGNNENITRIVILDNDNNETRLDFSNLVKTKDVLSKDKALFKYKYE